jgi:hypothetical protein
MMVRELRLDHLLHGKISEEKEAAKAAHHHSEPAIRKKPQEKSAAKERDQGNNRDKDVLGANKLAKQISQGERNQEGALQKTAYGCHKVHSVFLNGTFTPG